MFIKDGVGVYVWQISLDTIKGPYIHKVEGAKANTPSKTNTYKRLPITNTLLPWTVPGGVGVSGPTKWRF